MSGGRRTGSRPGCCWAQCLPFAESQVPRRPWEPGGGGAGRGLTTPWPGRQSGLPPGSRAGPLEPAPLLKPHPVSPAPSSPQTPPATDRLPPSLLVPLFLPHQLLAPLVSPLLPLRPPSSLPALVPPAPLTHLPSPSHRSPQNPLRSHQGLLRACAQPQVQAPLHPADINVHKSWPPPGSTPGGSAGTQATSHRPPSVMRGAPQPEPGCLPPPTSPSLPSPRSPAQQPHVSLVPGSPAWWWDAPGCQTSWPLLPGARALGTWRRHGNPLLQKPPHVISAKLAQSPCAIWPLPPSQAPHLPHPLSSETSFTLPCTLRVRTP